MELIFKLSKKGQIYLILCSNLSTSNIPSKFALRIHLTDLSGFLDNQKSY